jgi:hypothetical protein
MFYRVGVDCTGYCWYRSYTFPVTKTYIYISSSVLCGSGFGFPNSIDTSNMYGWADVEFVPAGILIPITNDTYNDTTVTPSNTYYYQVRASNGGGYSGYSPEANVTTPPATPGALTATAISSSQINLSWTGVTGETGYEIERKTGYNGIYGPFGSTIPGTTTYTDTAVSIGNIYYYRVYAFNTGGSGGYSPEASMVTGGDWSKFTAGGPNSAIACKTNGTLWGLWTGSNIPYRIGTDADWSTVAACTNAMYLANDFSIFACKTNKTLWAWGANTSGQLGLGGTYGPPLGIPKSNR